MSSFNILKGPDTLSELLKEPKRNARHDIWLWLYLFTVKNFALDPRTCNGLTMRDEIALHLKFRNNTRQFLAREKDLFLIPDDSLTWIEADERQYRWLLRRILDITNLELTRSLVHLSGREHLIALIDIWNVDLERKASEVENLKYAWHHHIAADSAFEWFEGKKGGAERFMCAREWLEKNKRFSFYSTPPIRNYQELLMYFDKAEFGHNEQKAIINEIKRRWNRKQLDVRNPDKKQVNVMLSKTVITQLDELAKKHDLKRAQILEKLIRMETDAGTYLTD